MGHKGIIPAFFCILAFAVVFAHSVVPHEHHCNEAVERHIHHFQHCEDLDIFVPRLDADDSSRSGCILLTADLLPEILRIGGAACEAPQRTLFDLSDHFRTRLRPDIPHGALRGPPAGI